MCLQGGTWYLVGPQHHFPLSKTRCLWSLCGLLVCRLPRSSPSFSTVGSLQEEPCLSLCPMWIQEFIQKRSKNLCSHIKSWALLSPKYFPAVKSLRLCLIPRSCLSSSHQDGGKPGQMGPSQPRAKGLGCTSAQPALPFPACGKRAQHLFTSVVNHPSWATSASLTVHH